jgi:hypothetical protein
VLIAGIGLLGVGFTVPAQGCVYLPVVCIGGPDCNPTPAERRARMRRESSELTRDRTRKAQQRLVAGHFDAAPELAELLVPNVRPIYVVQTDCGPMGEIDLGGEYETRESYFRRLVAQSPLDGARPFAHARLHDWLDEAPYGERCNLEFRRGFAAHLRRSMTEDDLRRSWVFLSARRRGDRRLMRFEGSTRRPPVSWLLMDQWLDRQVQTWLRRQAAGRALQAAVDSFWTHQSAELGDDQQVCPAFSAQWAAERERMVAELMALRPGRSRR